MTSNSWNLGIPILNKIPCTRLLKGPEHTKKFYNTRECGSLISSARIRPKPYEVHYLKYSEFYDLQTLTENMIYNTTINTSGDKVLWMKIKWIRLQKSQPNIIQYKYDLNASSFYEIDTLESKRRSGRKRKWESA